MDISGAWLGTYMYSGVMAHMAPVRFEAVFVLEAVGGFSGQITDAEVPGEADVLGRQENGRVQFVKTYRRSGRGYTLPILYKGTLSEDGQYLRGSWCLERRFLGLSLGRAEGTWGARRSHLPEEALSWPPPPQTAD